jgi:hypothetical protein
MQRLEDESGKKSAGPHRAARLALLQIETDCREQNVRLCALVEIDRRRFGAPSSERREIRASVRARLGPAPVGHC